VARRPPSPSWAACGRSGPQRLLAAADTFRAGAIDQLKIWGDRIGVPVVAHQPGGDPSAVVFDALDSARARQTDVVVIDTAGRLHTKQNLMEELRKTRRVLDRFGLTDPSFLLVQDATSGQTRCCRRHITESVGVTGVLLARWMDAKGRRLRRRPKPPSAILYVVR